MCNMMCITPVKGQIHLLVIVCMSVVWRVTLRIVKPPDSMNPCPLPSKILLGWQFFKRIILAMTTLQQQQDQPKQL